MAEKVHIFWDGNNIKAGAEDTATDVIGEPGYPRLRVYFKNLLQLVAKDRDVAQAWMAGNIPPPEDEVWTHAERLGIRTMLEKRTEDGKEGLMDETLREKMLTTDFDYAEKGVIALLTGDGAGVHEDEGFFANLKRLHSRGWEVEVYSWEVNIHSRMKDWVQKNGRYTALDEFFESITFLKPDENGEGERIVEPLPKVLQMDFLEN